jgi:hypothetical protein
VIAGCGHAEDFGGSERPPPSATLGAACDSDLQCEVYCARDRTFPQGFCTVHPCHRNSDCPDGTVCITEQSGVCVYPCAVQADCGTEFMLRPGYSCQPALGYNSETATNVRYQVCLGG